MGRDDRYTETYSAEPDEPQSGAYVIPPLDERGRRRGVRDERRTARPIRSAVAPNAPSRPARRRLGSGGWIVLAIAVIVGFVLLVGSGVAATLVGSVVQAVTGEPEGADDDEEGFIPARPRPSASPSPTPTRAALPTDFSPTDEDMLVALQTTPTAYAAVGFAVYGIVIDADVERADLPEGAAAHRVWLSTYPPSGENEHFASWSFLVVDPEGREVSDGDALRLSVAVTDLTQEDYVFTTELEAADLEVIGWYDLGQDVGLGETYDEDGDLVLPVEATNSAGEEASYRIAISAVSPGGEVLSEAVVWLDDLDPGERGSDTVHFWGAIPEGMTFRIDGVERW